MDTYSCRPFYYSGCGGNYNNFLSRQQCRSVCPDTLQPAIDKPVIDMEDGVHRVLEAENVTISVNIRYVTMAFTKSDIEIMVSVGDHILTFFGNITTRKLFLMKESENLKITQ